MAYRIVRGPAGTGRIQLIPNKCKYNEWGRLCLEPVRLAPGAVYCKFHQPLENAGCAAHDKLNCREKGCFNG